MRWRALTLMLACALAPAAFAEGPGSRLRTSPEIELPPKDAAKRCNGLRYDLKQRCLAEARTAPAERKTSGPEVGPESTGMGSGAGARSTSGTTGGASFGGTAPR
jgi:hypothetical protein